jgi:hypothetical protein
VTVYLLDANVFIEAARRYYAFDLVPRFWEHLIRNAEVGQIGSIDRVRDELERGRDELATWVQEKFVAGFASTDDMDVIRSFAELMTWVQAQGQFTDAAKADFARVADGWLVAYALVKGCIIVTHEVPAPDARRKVPIPNLCEAFNVPFVDTFEMLRALGIRLA